MTRNGHKEDGSQIVLNKISVRTLPTPNIPNILNYYIIIITTNGVFLATPTKLFSTRWQGWNQMTGTIQGCLWILASEMGSQHANIFGESTNIWCTIKKWRTPHLVHGNTDNVLLNVCFSANYSNFREVAPDSMATKDLSNKKLGLIQLKYCIVIPTNCETQRTPKTAETRKSLETRCCVCCCVDMRVPNKKLYPLPMQHHDSY